MKKCLLIFCFILLGLSAKSQDYYKKDTVTTTPSTFIIRLKDGTQLLGKIIEQNTVESKIQTENMGLITVKANQILSMELYDKNKSTFNKSYYDNRFVNRFLFTPSAFPMEEKAIEFHNVLLYYSEFAAALNKRLSVGFGFFTLSPLNFIISRLK